MSPVHLNQRMRRFEKSLTDNWIHNMIHNLNEEELFSKGSGREYY